MQCLRVKWAYILSFFRGRFLDYVRDFKPQRLPQRCAGPAQPPDTDMLLRRGRRSLVSSVFCRKLSGEIITTWTFRDIVCRETLPSAFETPTLHGTAVLYIRGHETLTSQNACYSLIARMYLMECFIFLVSDQTKERGFGHQLAVRPHCL